MRIYYHPTVGDYAKYDSFEVDQAALAGVPSGIAAGIAGWAFKRASWETLLASLGGGGLMAGAFGAFYPKRVLSWFNPPPFDAPIVYPRQIPKVVVPSFIGESGQVLNLLMHHGSGRSIRDYSGLGNHGAISGGFSWVDGSYGWSVELNGLDGYVEVPDSPSLRLTNGLTLEWWMQWPVDNTEWGLIIGKGGSWGQRGYSVLAPANRGLYFEIDNAAGTAVVASIYPPLPPAMDVGKWFMVQATFDGANMRLYVNNSLVAGPAAQTDIGVDPAIPFRIGKHTTTAEYLRFRIAMAKVYNRALTDAERTNHFESTRAIFGV
jgi:hypothetical protein